MATNRLQELQRQRALMQEHLTWLDQQIAAEAGTPAGELITAPAPAVTLRPANAITPLNPSSTAAQSSRDPTISSLSENLRLPPEAQIMVNEYEKRGADIHSEVKRGCIIYLLAAFALVGVGVLALYLYSRFK